MYFRVLGPVQVDDAGTPIKIPGAKERALLALLLSRANEVVSVDEIVEQLWGGDPPRSASKSLQAHVVRLRDALESGRPRGTAGSVILTRSPGYLARVTSEQLDRLQFRSLADEGRRGLRAGSFDAAADAARAALDLWHGRAYGGLEHDFADHERRRLDEERSAVQEDRLDADLGRGLAETLVPELEAMVAAEPLRERRWGQLVVALYRAGRQADALAALARVRGLLADEFGVDPGPALTDLQARVLAQDRELLHPASRLLPARLPGALDPADPVFAGRDAELDALLAWWRADTVGPITLTGPPGAGKTRLAAELARRLHRDGVPVVYASAQPATTDRLAVLARVTAAVDATPVEIAGGDGTAADLGAAAGSAFARLAGRQGLLLVLDDLDLDDETMLSALSTFAEAARSSPMRILLAGNGRPPHWSGCVDLGGVDHEAVVAIAALYAGAADAGLVAASVETHAGGIPGRVHEEAARLVRDRAKRHVGVAAARSVDGSRLLRTAHADLVVGLAALDDVDAARILRSSHRAPYKGLSRFEVGDADLFFGREGLVRELVARLARSELIVITGPSGTGKSSLARAGLLAALRRGVLPGSETWRLLDMTPGAHPLEALRAVGPEPWAEIADRAASGGGRLVLLVDQLEELVTTCQDETERHDFLDELTRLACREDAAGSVVLTVRSDHLGFATALHPGFAAKASEGVVLVGPMSATDLARAVELPARRMGYGVESGLTTAVAADVVDEPGGLPLFSTVLLELWENRAGESLRLQDYRRSGGMRGAVSRLGESVWNQLDEPERDCAKRLLLRLAGGGTGSAAVSRRVALTELTDEGQPGRRVLAQLIDRRLLTVAGGPAGETVEVAHEALLREWPRLRGWLEEDEQGRRLHHHLADTARDWDAGGRDAADLYRGVRLAAAADWASANPELPNRVERDFLSAGRERADREWRQSEAQARSAVRAARRLRLALVGVVALLAVSLVAGAIAFQQRSAARREALQAQVQAAAAEVARAEATREAAAAQAARLGSAALLQDDLDRRMLLAAAAYRLARLPATRSALLSSLLSSPRALRVIRSPATRRLVSLATAPDGPLMAGGTNDGRVILWRVRAGELVSSFRVDPAAGVPTVQFSPDGSQLAALTQRGTVHVLDLARTDRLDRSNTFTGLRGRPATALAWEATGALLIARADGALARVDSESGTSHLVGRAQLSNVSALAVDPTGDQAALAGGGAMAVVDLATGAVRSVVTAGVFGRVLAFSDDGEHLLSAGTTDVVLREATTLEGVRRFQGHTAAPVVAELSPNGQVMASAGRDGRIILWDVRTGKPLEIADAHTRTSGLAFISDGRTMVTSGTEFTSGTGNIAVVWDATGRRRFGHQVAPGAMGQIGDRPRAGADVLPVDRGKQGHIGRLLVRRLDVRPKLLQRAAVGPVNSVRVTSNGGAVAVGGNAGQVVMLDTASSDVLAGPADVGNPVRTLELSPDESLLSVGTDEGLVVLDTNRLRLQSRLTIGDAVDSLAFSPDGSRLALGHHSGRVSVLAWPSLARVVSLRPEKPGDWVLALAWAPDGSRVATGYHSGTVQVADASTGRPVGRILRGTPGPVLSVDISPSGERVLAGGAEGTTTLWDVSLGDQIGRPLVAVSDDRGEAVQAWTFAHFSAGGSVVTAVVAWDGGQVWRWPADPRVWLRRACHVAGRDLTDAERAQFGLPKDFRACLRR